MGSSPPCDTTAEATPSNKQRCNKNDGKLWRCSNWKMEGKSLCNRHFLKQQENYKKNKKNITPQSHNQPKKNKNKRKTSLDNTARKKKKMKNEKEENSEDDDSIEKLFEGYPSEKEDDDDSIEKLFGDDWTTDESDGHSCQSFSKASAISTCAQEEPVEELKKNQEDLPSQSTT